MFCLLNILYISRDRKIENMEEILLRPHSKICFHILYMLAEWLTVRTSYQKDLSLNLRATRELQTHTNINNTMSTVQTNHHEGNKNHALRIYAPFLLNIFTDINNDSRESLFLKYTLEPIVKFRFRTIIQILLSICRSSDRVCHICKNL